MTPGANWAIKEQSPEGSGPWSHNGDLSRHGVIFPQVGNWYRRVDDRLFEVVAIDEMARTAEIQYFDGTISELDFDSWHELELEPAAAPEDWTGAVDIDQQEIPELKEQIRHNWQDPLELLDHIDE